MSRAAFGPSWSTTFWPQFARFRRMWGRLRPTLGSAPFDHNRACFAQGWAGLSRVLAGFVQVWATLSSRGLTTFALGSVKFDTVRVCQSGVVNGRHVGHARPNSGRVRLTGPFPASPDFGHPSLRPSSTRSWSGSAKFEPGSTKLGSGLGWVREGGPGSTMLETASGFDHFVGCARKWLARMRF